MTAREELQAALQEWTGAFMRNSMRSLLLFSKERGLSVPQIGALFRIHRGDCSVSDLGSELGVTNAAASQMIDRLVQQGLLERSEHPIDRRAKYLALTPRGQALVQQAIEARMRWIEDLTTTLTSEQQQAIAAALTTLTQAARDL